MSHQEKPEASHHEMVSDNESEKELGVEAENLILNARNATKDEHELTASRALRDYFPAVCWSLIMSSTIIMEGYDTSLMGNFFAFTSFQKKYGVEIAPGSYSLTGQWQSALGCASSIGIIIALAVNGILVERFGHRKIVLVNLVVMAGFLFITVFAKNVEMLLVGQILCGFPWGFFSVVGLIYASEVSPLPLRGFLSAYVMMCWATGQLVACGVLRAMLSNTSHWSYRIPFAVQWAWIPPLFIATWFCPDSPYWLVRRGELEKAEEMVKRLSHKSIHHLAKQRVNLMIYTNELEKDQQDRLDDRYKGWKAYRECFRGTNLRRTEIACMAMAGQVFAGNNFAYLPSYFFSQVGLDSVMTYNMNLAITAVAWVGTFMSWFLANKVGRRKIFLAGLTFMTAFLLVIGILQTPASNTGDLKYSWGQVGCTFGWCVAFVLSLAPLGYTVMSEVSSTRLRAVSIAIGRNAYNLVQLVAQVVEPKFINPTELDMKGRTSYIWFCTSFLLLIWTYFRLPETKDRTYEELDILFEKGISARKFSSYQMDLDAEEIDRVSVKAAAYE
ncbi:hypothetical protein PSN45_003623 [Yamadazyma tenuis]|uniref:Major facilitator superfamily (MFS) profile domain-containing protein n=1 Tax=Candida tenuis (strain ATCC 10573 / BCRC 21748 / CBS 615 / JCM 9827 / NBRC 10315 / NRRL Y-1498 / VKM Y-70) TaxID=590646 RepID=G3AZJ7_CANTC|nr:uncharacterized protein CANTEDRAFT_133003 [Yamadazyma tenuis ATCC 10573]EGV65597.1 hypothetical protein CANTEDRAFT_133003 [Yamadazyma tenuis ATCC 10573]WEJ96088.1 hypothetical protein PSN45_003623 [Yamadazyma tenuis]